MIMFLALRQEKKKNVILFINAQHFGTGLFTQAWKVSGSQGPLCLMWNVLHSNGFALVTHLSHPAVFVI